MRRKVAILLSGSVMAQALPLLAAPLLSRLYSPESFGQFGLFIAVGGILAAVANLKYDHAVLLVRNTVAAHYVFCICVVSTAALALFFTVVLACLPVGWLGFAGVAMERSQMFWLPVGFMLAGLTQSLMSLSFRSQQFGGVAKVRVAQAITTTLASLSLGVLQPTGSSLIFSALAGQALGVLLLLQLQKQEKFALLRMRWSLLWRFFKRYRRFSIFTTPSDLINAFSANLPMLFVGSFFGLAAAGSYALAQRTLGLPLMLIGSAFSDAYRQSAANSFTTDGEYWGVTIHMFRTMCLIAIAPLLICLFFSSLIFTTLFGSEWVLAGEVVQVLALAYFARLVVSPLSYSYYLANRHSEDLVLQCLSFALTVAVFFYSKAAEFSLVQALALYAGLLFLVYSTYGLRSLHFARASKARQIMC